MKRLIAFALVLCMVLLCGCQNIAPTPPAPENDPSQTPSADAPVTNDPVDDPSEDPSEEPSEDPSEEPSEDPTEESTDEPAQPEPVTVYLLQEAFLFDNGPVTFQYDENYNVVGYTSADIEGQVVFTGHFAQPDANGMPSRYGTVWYDGSAGEDRVLVWDQDGKLMEDRAVGVFTGTQYDYDEQGRLLERREYYEGMLDRIVYYEYRDDTLSACWCEDSLCSKVFECRVINGFIVEQTFYDYTTPYGYLYEYDQNGNLARSTFMFDGEGLPGTQYTYIQVQVSPERARYLQEQQKFLMTLV